MIEKWLQITCDECEDAVDNSTWPNMTVKQFWEELRQCGWRRRSGKDMCGTCCEQQDLEKSRNERSKSA